MAIKITTDQLDASILDKLTRLDAMESSYKKENGNVVMYNGDNFYTGKFPEMPKQKVVYFSYNEIADMREALYKSNSKYKSAADTYMTMGKIYASNFKNLLTSVEPTRIFEKEEEDILLTKTYGNFYYIYTNLGNIYKIVKNNTNMVNKINIIKNIKEYFIPNFDSRDVLCFIPYSDGYLVSTLNNGVFYITENSAELKFSFNGVFKLFISPNHNIICISKFEKPAVIIYDFASGEKITTSNKLRMRDKQYPRDALMLDNGDFCILGKPSGGNPSDNLLHYWKLDEAQIGYNYIDIGSNKASIFYEVKFLNESADHIYISGVNQNRLFVWVYDKLDLKREPEEIIFDKINITYDDLLLVDINDGLITFNIRDRLLTIDKNCEVIENLTMRNFDGTKEMLGGNTIVCIKEHSINVYLKQKYGYAPNISLEIYNGNIPCNNINIYTASTEATERMAFFNGETLEQIIPAYYGITSDFESIINISDCSAKKIIMKIMSPKSNIIKGVVVNTNQLYIK